MLPRPLHNLGPEFWDKLVRPGVGNSGRAFVERRAIWTNDLIGNSSVLYSDADTDKIIKNLGSEWGLIGVVAAPIIIQDEVYFVLNVIFDKHRDFTDEEVNLVQNLADSAAVAINNARFIKETQQARDEATQLYEITQQLASSKNMESVLDLIVTKATELLGSDATAIWRMDQSKDALVVARGYNVPSDWAENVVIKPGEGTTGRAFKEGRPAWSLDVQSDPDVSFSDEPTEAARRSVGIAGALAVPIITRDQSYGALNTFYYEPHNFTDEEVNLVQNLADSAAVAINNARFIDETQQARKMPKKPTGRRASSWPT